MDVLTQGIIGAAVAQSVSNKHEMRKAAIVGFLAGLAADADVLIRSSSDPMLVLEYHRHFSHSLIFIPIAAIIVSILLWPFFRKTLSFKRLYFYSFAGTLLSGFVDACTSYGTHLLWPFINERIAWHIIAIIDPIFTIALIIGVVYALIKLTPVSCRFALIFCGGYLLLGYFQLQRAEIIMHELAEKRGHVVERFMVKPTIGNLVLWRSIYLSHDEFYIDAIRVGIENKIYEGEAIKQFETSSLPDNIDKNTTLYNDIKRFQFFSDNFVIWHPDKLNALGDVRYAMSPTSVIPLWGIELNYAEPDKHVNYEFYREIDDKKRQAFVSMLFGAEILPFDEIKR